jgi:carbonic anhydrase
MKSLHFAIMAILFTCVSTAGMAQNKKKHKKSATTPVVIDSAKWRADYYIEDRDLAYADPAIGLKKLIGGNRRFVEGREQKMARNPLQSLWDAATAVYPTK